MKKKEICYILLNIIMFIVSILFSIYSYTYVSLVLNIISSIFLIINIKNLNDNYISYSLFFIGFSALYGLSGPVNVLWGDGLHEIFSIPYYTDEFLIGYSLANMGFIFGAVIYNLISRDKLQVRRIDISLKVVRDHYEQILILSICLIIIGLIFELINIIRIGGVFILFTGKANYQGLISQLRLSLPSSIIASLAFSYFSLYLSGSYSVNKQLNYKNRIRSLLFLLLSLPFLMINMILGRRGILLSLVISTMVGITYFKSVKKLKLKLIIILVIVYILLSFLYANRSIVNLVIEDPKMFVEMVFAKERFITALNPGVNEFGAAFGNFSEYYRKYEDNFDLKFGSTYVKGLILPIPSFLYPGDKPIQITYEFRNEFFPAQANKSSIAGTGFSSILEAYINFKYFGIFFVYIILGYFTQFLDKKYKYISLNSMILYISLFSQTQTFHRSAFGSIFTNVLVTYVSVIFFNTFLFTIIKKRKLNF